MLFYVDVNYLDDEYKVDSDLSSSSEDEDGKKADEEERREREERQKVIDKTFPDHKKKGFKTLKSFSDEEEEKVSEVRPSLYKQVPPKKTNKLKRA